MYWADEVDWRLEVKHDEILNLFFMSSHIGGIKVQTTSLSLL